MGFSEKKDKNLIEIKARLIKRFNPLRILLFGSRSQDKHRPTSDYDIVLVVKKRKGSLVENMLVAADLVEDLNVSVDVFVYSEKTFDEWKNELSSIPETALSSGVELSLG